MSGPDLPQLSVFGISGIPEVAPGDDLAALIAGALTAGGQRVGDGDILVITSLGLIPWIVLLGLTLPRRYVADHWAVAWVGFDVALLCLLVLTAWAAWRRREIVIVAALVTGTMLVVDAWFDIVTDSSTGDLVISALTAVFGELPLAALLFAGALRLLRLTTHTARTLAGDVDDLLLWRVPLFGIDPIE